MTAAKGGTIELGGKTYNISQINSVSVESVRRHSGINSGIKIFTLYIIAGIIITVMITLTMVHFPLVWVERARVFWFIITGFATWFAWSIAKKEDYAVVFDMSSGKVSAYSNESKAKVEKIRDDIIKGMEEGYFPNYLQGRN